MPVSPAPVVWSARPHAPAPVGAILRARRTGARVVDDSGRELGVSPFRLVVETVRLVWQRVAYAVLAGLAAVATRRRSPPLRREGADPKGPVVVVLPVLPDVSHTFVYREVAALLRLRSDWRCIVLAHNPTAPQHAEAKALLPFVHYLPRSGVTGRVLRVLRWLLTARGRELFALYRSQPGGSVRALVSRRAIRDPRDPGNAFELADFLRPLSPQHVHVYSSTHPTNVAMGAAHLLALPFSVSSYVDFEFAYEHKLLAEKVARATFFRVVTRFCQQRLLAMQVVPTLTPERVPVVYLGLDLGAWREAARPGRRGVLVSAARLVPKKGLQFVPAALRRLRELGVPFEWRVVGDGPMRAELERSCRDHGIDDAVTFLGALDSDAVRRELLVADLAVLPCVVADDGERDGIPVFLNEAMALGVPVVTTPVSGIPEMVRDLDTGFLAAPGDSAALATVLARALRERDLADAVGARGRALVHETLDVDASAAALLARIEA